MTQQYGPDVVALAELIHRIAARNECPANAILTAKVAAPSSASQELGRPAYSVAEAAASIGISERRTWDLVQQRTVMSFTVGNRRLISRRGLEAYVYEREAQSS